MMLFLALLLPALWLIERRAERLPRAFAHTAAGARRPVYAIGLAALAALLIATAVYYGRYPLIIARTLPYFFGGAAGQVGIRSSQPFLAYLVTHPRLGYTARPVMFGLWIPLVLAPIGLLRLRNMLALAICWAIVTVLFTIAGNHISMVDKQIFYFMPAMMLLAAPVLDWAWRRGLLGRMAVACTYLLSFAAALGAVDRARGHDPPVASYEP
ncbi:MAG: hypothetical protein U0Z44_05365 [Kouleothrix sp.]